MPNLFHPFLTRPFRALILLCFLAVATPTALQAQCALGDLSADEAELARLLNAYRAANGLDTLANAG